MHGSIDSTILSLSMMALSHARSHVGEAGLVYVYLCLACSAS